MGNPEGDRRRISPEAAVSGLLVELAEAKTELKEARRIGNIATRALRKIEGYKNIPVDSDFLPTEASRALDAMLNIQTKKDGVP